MGMDVYGTNPVSETGRYFRRNIWGWRPLWDYVEIMHPEIAALVEYGHTNDGDGLSGIQSLVLANLLKEDLVSGATDQYIVQRTQALAELPLDDCTICEGTGIRTDEIGSRDGQPVRVLEEAQAIILGRTEGWCNGCNGEGTKENFLLNYDLAPEDVKDFSDFLQDCGGFEIW
tara:strand:+ start:917 stop:1435 length:519 start_codon:yes stop_codon:yes gene_type:complete